MKSIVHAVPAFYAGLLGHRGKQLVTSSVSRKWYLGAIAALFAACFGIVAFVIAIDPYDLYPWGKSPSLPRETYSATAIPLVIKAVTKGDYDTFYIGASTSAGFSAWDMRDTLSGTQKAFNLSLLGASMNDLAVMMDLVAKAPHVRRALVQMELPFATAMTVDPRFVHIPTAISSPDVTESLRAVDATAIELAWKSLTKQEFFSQNWGARDATQFLDWARAHYKTPEYATRLSAVVDDNRARLSRGTRLTCANFPGLSILRDFAGKLLARGVELDVVFPPYSRAMWFEWVAPGSDFQWKSAMSATGTPFDFFLLMRRCATAQMKEFPNAKVFAFDGDADIVDDYANYADPGHPGERKVYLGMLRAIAAGTHQLTAETFPAYERVFRERVTHYKFYDSTAK